MVKEASKTSQDRRTSPDSKPVRLNAAAREVLDSLNELGFDRPVEFLLKNDPSRIKAVIDYMKAQRSGAFRNPAGFIRARVASSVAMPVAVPSGKEEKYREMFCDGICRNCTHPGSLRSCDVIGGYR